MTVRRVLGVLVAGVVLGAQSEDDDFVERALATMVAPEPDEPMVPAVPTTPQPVGWAAATHTVTDTTDGFVLPAGDQATRRIFLVQTSATRKIGFL